MILLNDILEAWKYSSCNCDWKCLERQDYHAFMQRNVKSKGYHLSVGNDIKQYCQRAIWVYVYLKGYAVYSNPIDSLAPPIEVSLFLNSRFQLGAQAKWS